MMRVKTKPLSNQVGSLGRLINSVPGLGLLGLISILLFQAFAYYSRLTLSLGPRVILDPWLLQSGFLLYENIIDQHSPLMSLVLSGLTLLPLTGFNLARSVLVSLISLTTFMTFLVGYRSGSWRVGLAAALFFALWSPVFGFGKLWLETFLAPLYLLFLLLYDPSADQRSLKLLLLVGLLGGVSILIKQHAAVVLSALVLWNAYAGWNTKRSFIPIVRDTGVLFLGAIIPILAFVIYHYSQAGTLQNFFYWTIGYNLFSNFRSLAALSPTLEQIRIISPAFLLIPAMIFSLVELQKRGDKIWLNWGWGLTLLATSSLTVYPRFALFHFQAALPVLACLTSVTLAFALRQADFGSQTSPYFARGIAIALYAFWLIWAGPSYRFIIRSDQPRQISEYTDLVPLAAEIRQQIGTNDCIYIFPDDEALANMYYLLKCYPPKFLVQSYPWFMTDYVKGRILLTLRQNPPEWIVYFPGRWDIENSASEVIAYVQQNYVQYSKLQWAQGNGWLLKRIH